MNHHDLFMAQIDELLKKEHLTLNGLATAAGITQSTLSNMYNRPNAVPKLDTLYAIAEGLNMSITELLDFPPYNERPDGSSPAKDQSKWDKLGNILTSDEKQHVYEALTGQDFSAQDEVEK